MKNIKYFEVIVVALFLGFFLTGNVSHLAQGGELADLDKPKITLNNETDQPVKELGPVGEVVNSQQPYISPEEQVLLDKLRLARISGDEIQMQKILDMLPSGEEAASDSSTNIKEVDTGETYIPGADQADESNIGLEFGLDILVAGTANKEGNPDIASTHGWYGNTQGELYLVQEDVGLGQNDINIYRSINRNSWSLYGTISGGSIDLKNPAITTIGPEVFFVVYESGNSIKMLNVKGVEWIISTIVTNSSGVHRPRITTDFFTEPPSDFCIYVIWSDFIGTTPRVRSAMSFHEGNTWTNFTTHYTGVPGGQLSWADIAYGGYENEPPVSLFVVWDRDSGDGNWDVYVRNSTSGIFWSEPVNLTGGTNRPGSMPRVSAASTFGRKEAIVVYNSAYSPADNDIEYAYTNDLGVSWSTLNPLDVSGINTERPDIAISVGGDNFHVTYWKEGWHSVYRRTPFSDITGGWSTPVIVNDGGKSTRVYYPSTVAVWPSDEPCVAWSDFRNSSAPSDYDIFSDSDLSAPCTLSPKFQQATVQNGMTYYTDRTYTFTNVPSHYIGLDVIKAPNDDRNNTCGSGYMEFIMPQNGTVFVAYDRRATNLPGWMNGFTSTGEIINTSLGTQGWLKVYSKQFSANDCVDLGCNKGAEFSGGTMSNYCVFYGNLIGGGCTFASKFQLGTLQNGMTYYTDRAYSLTSVPTQYVGMSMFKAPNDDRNNTCGSGYMQFELELDATVFVAYDRRATSLPDWMNGFTDTGEIINTSLGTQGWLKVYSKQFLDGTCVKLGCNKGAGFSGGTVSNYCVFYGNPDGVDCTLASKFQQGTLLDGMTYYTDRTYTLTNVPIGYRGLVMIKTPNDDRDSTCGHSYVEFNASTVVYVAYDRRATALPDWMNGFTDTGDIINTSLSTQGWLKIYRKEFFIGTCVKLGCNKGTGFTGGTTSNYIVIIAEYE